MRVATAVVAVTILYGSLSLVGCDEVLAGKSPHAKTDDEKIAEMKAKDKIFMEYLKVDVSDTAMLPTRGIIVSGDQRPIWRVSGRVQNNAAKRDVRTAVVRFYVVDAAGNQYDTADVTVRGIASQETKAFQQDVHLLPPAKIKWMYHADVMAVEFTDGVKFP